MPDLGPYAFAVLGSYAAGFVLIGALIWASLRAAARSKAALEALEGKSDG